LSLVDIELNRELIPKGQRANRLILYNDQPLYWDAWDVELYHLESPVELGLGTTTIVDQGPLRVGLLVEHKISDESWIKTTISLDAFIPTEKTYTDGFKDPLTYLRFESEVEWHENRRFLKTEFPVDIYCDTVCIPLRSRLTNRHLTNLNSVLLNVQPIIILLGIMPNSKLFVTNGLIFLSSDTACPF